MAVGSQVTVKVRVCSCDNMTHHFTVVNPTKPFRVSHLTGVDWNTIPLQGRVSYRIFAGGVKTTGLDVMIKNRTFTL